MRKCHKYSLLSIAIFLVLFASTAVGLVIGPLHASCKVTWKFGSNWTEVKTDLVNQITLWNGPENCQNGGEKCLYTLESSTDKEIKAVHETPKKHYKDDISFTLISDGDSSCTVEGYSTSETWYALLDQGTNYCNMENLIVGAGLNKAAGYTETTSNSICTQQESANCEVY